MITKNLTPGEKYELIIDEEGKKRLEVLYLGINGRQPSMFPHEFIGRLSTLVPFESRDTIISFRIRNEGFQVAGKLVTPIPEECGAIFYTAIYKHDLEGQMDQISAEERIELSDGLERVGL